MRVRRDRFARRLPRGGVGRNRERPRLACERPGRLPRGGVGRNSSWLEEMGATVWSPPARRRGSKPMSSHRAEARGCRLPRGGVGRNGKLRRADASTRASPPARRRGSKPAYIVPIGNARASPPARRRGSKHGARPALPHHEGRLPRGGVGRNAVVGIVVVTVLVSPPARRRGSKPIAARTPGAGRSSPPARRRGSKRRRATEAPEGERRLPRGGVGRNTLIVVGAAHTTGRLPRGGVGRNKNMKAQAWWSIVASRAEAWVETSRRARRRRSIRVASRAEAWVETAAKSDPITTPPCRLPRGGVGRNGVGGRGACGAAVASRAEAWVETWIAAVTAAVVWSPPARRRGSKPLPPP